MHDHIHEKCSILRLSPIRAIKVLTLKIKWLKNIAMFVLY